MRSYGGTCEESVMQFSEFSVQQMMAFAYENRRASADSLSVPFDHDMSKHP